MESEDKMNEGRRNHETMIALGSQKELNLNGPISGKENCHARSENGRKDLKFDIRIGNDYGLASCKNLKVEGDSEKVKAVETRCLRIEVGSFKNIGKGRRNTIGWSGNTIDRQLIYWKSKIRRGIKMTSLMESI